MNTKNNAPWSQNKFRMTDVNVVEKVRVHDGYFKVDRYTLTHKKFAGDWSAPLNREIFERGHAVAVLLYDPDLDRIVFIEQFRPGAFAAIQSPWFDETKNSPWVLECVAGIIDEGETPETVAHRECLEEANCPLLDLMPVSHYLASPGGTSESIFLFCGRVNSQSIGGIHGLDTEGEDIRVFSVPTKTAIEGLKTNRYVNAMTLIAMQWFALNQDQIKQRWS